VISLADIRQQASHDCGDAAVRVVLRALRRRPFEPAIAHLATDPIDGTDPRAIETCLRAHGLLVLSGSATWGDLRHWTQNRPVICLVQRGGVGHWVVTGHVTQRRAHYQCPSIGPDSQGRTTFMNAWRDVDRLGAVYRQWAIVAWR
jgi:ABC-type bacteriocin/lantibiotic exporter with double-glycine peptidase domain